MIKMLKLKKIRRNKKAGHIFMLILLAMVIFAFSGLLIYVVSKTDDSKTIGSDAAKILQAAQKGDDMANYVDIAARYAVWQTEHQLAYGGGLLESECGRYDGAALWYHDGNICLPKDYKEDFKKLFAKNLEAGLDGYFNLPKNNYEFSILPDKVIGKAKKDVAVEGNMISVPSVFKLKATKPLAPTLPASSTTKKPVPDYNPQKESNICLMENYGSDPHDTVKTTGVTIGGKSRSVNVKMAEALTNVAKVIDAYGYYVHNWHSCRKGKGTGPSCGNLHTACLALDINPQENPHCPSSAKKKTWWKRDPSPEERERCVRGEAVGDIPIEIVQAFEDNGFYWGGRFSKPDTMHFQYVNECCKSRVVEPLADAIARVNYVLTSESIFAQYPRYDPKKKS